MNTIAKEQMTGLVLAGGRGTRMGGIDKGLQPYQGVPLALHALRRLEPQVGALMVNANRHLDTYAAMGAPVHADALADYPGPLAGLEAGLAHCRTPWLASVPCDSPNFPVDLVARLAEAVAREHAEIALAACIEDGAPRLQPVFCLVDVRLLPSLTAYLQSGQRKVERWAAQHRCVHVVFDDALSFFNANTLADLETLQPTPVRG
jgi:molybdopterin-guanine dinucleotide biosynthesis protein A